MIRLIDFQPDHAEELLTRTSALVAADCKHVMRTWLERMQCKDRAFTLMDNGHLIVAGGIFPIWEGFGEAWLIPSDCITDYKVKMIKTLRKHIASIAEADQLRRLQSSVRVDFPAAQRFIEFLGFEREGLMRRYGPDGADHYLYGRIS